MKKNQKKPSFLSSTLIYVFGSFLTSGLAFITTPIFTRLLTPEDYGITAVFATWNTVFVNFIGLQTLISIAPAHIHFDENKFEQYVSSILFLSTLSFLFFLIVGIVFKNTFATILNISGFLFLILLIQSFFGYVQQFYNNYLIQTKKPLKSLILSITYSVLSIGLSLLFIFNMDAKRYLGKILGNAIVICILGLILYFIIIFKGKKIISKKYWVYCLPLALPAIFNSMSSIVLSQSDRVMVQNILGNYEAGIYSLAHSIAFVMLTLWTATNNAWVPWYFENTKKRNDNYVNKMASKYIIIISFMSCLIMLIIPEAMKILGPEDYWPAGKVIPLIILGLYFYFLSMFAINFELYKENTKWIAVTTILAAVVNIILNLSLIPKWGIWGASFATFVSYLCSFILHNIVVKQFKSYNIRVRSYYIGIIIVFIGFLTITVLYDYIIVRLVLLLVFLLGILILKRKTIKNNIKKYLK